MNASASHAATMTSATDRQPAVRVALLAMILVAAAAHIPVIVPHLHEAPYMGVLFIVFTAACLMLGVRIAITGTTKAYAAASVVCGAGVLAYVATRLTAFPQLADDVGNWWEPLGVISVVSESLVVVLALVALRRQSAIATHRHSARR